MKLPKSKLGFLLAGVYIFILGLFLVYAKFACDMPDGLYCGMIAFMPAFPFILLTAIFTSIFLLSASADLEMIVIFFIPVLINVVLAYFIGSFIQKRFSQKIVRTMYFIAISVAVIAVIILGIRYVNKLDKFQAPVYNSNINIYPINGRGKEYCQQDSDCVSPIDKWKAVCEQNRCVVKEKPTTENQSIVSGLQFSIRPEKTSYQYKKDKPITIYGKFKNITNKNIYFYTPEATLSVTYEAFDPKRKKIEVPSYIADPAPPEKKDFVLIKPGESLAKTLNLHLGIEENAFTPGVYSVAVMYDIWQTGYYENGKLVNLNGWSGKIKSNPVEVVIEKDNNSYILWNTAIEILNSGKVKSVSQSHDLTVGFGLKNGKSLRAKEPVIDAIMYEIKKCGNICKDIIYKTE